MDLAKKKICHGNRKHITIRKEKEIKTIGFKYLLYKWHYATLTPQGGKKEG